MSDPPWDRLGLLVMELSKGLHVQDLPFQQQVCIKLHISIIVICKHNSEGYTSPNTNTNTHTNTYTKSHPHIPYLSTINPFSPPCTFSIWDSGRSYKSLQIVKEMFHWTQFSEMSFKLILIVGDSLFNFFNRFQVIHESYNMNS